MSTRVDYGDPLWMLDQGIRRSRLLLEWGKPPSEAVRQLVSDGELDPDLASLAVRGAMLMIRFEDEARARHAAVTRPVARPPS